jgi:hypothetical protein
VRGRASGSSPPHVGRNWRARRVHAALAALLGDDAAGLSATNIARLTNEWEVDGALGFWAAVRDVWPKTRAQARWQQLDGAHLLRLARAGFVCVDGVHQEGNVNGARARAA